MSKKVRILALILCSTILLSACDSSSKHHKKHKRDRDDSEVTSEETEDTEESTTEATTEPTTERTLPETSETTEASDEVSEPLSTSELILILSDYINTVHEEYPDATFAFNSMQLYVRLSPDDDTFIVYSISDDGTVYGDCVEFEFNPIAYGAPIFTYDEITSYPVPLSYPRSTIDSLEDGTYYGNLIAISSDSSSAVLCVGEAIDLSLLDNVNITFNEETYEYEGNIIYNGQTYDTTELSYDICYQLYNSNLDSGTGYLLGDSDCFLPINIHHVIVPISPDCEFSASGPWTFYYGEDSIPFGSYSYTGSFFETEMYAEISQYCEDVIVNDYWYANYSWLVEPVVISDGEITEITLGVR